MGAVCTSDRDVREPAPPPAAAAAPATASEPVDPRHNRSIVCCIDRLDPATGELSEYFPPLITGQLAVDVGYRLDWSQQQVEEDRPAAWYALIAMLNERRWKENQQQQQQSSADVDATSAPVAPAFGDDAAPFYFSFPTCNHIIAGRTTADADWLMKIFQDAFPERKIRRM